jgi:hypothetical protein
MSKVTESLSVLVQVSSEVAWKSQAAISLLIHRVRALRTQPSPQWDSALTNSIHVDVTEDSLKQCLQTLYMTSDVELSYLRPVLESHIFGRFQTLPYVRSLSKDLPCEAYLVEVEKGLEYSHFFFSYVWTGLLVEPTRDLRKVLQLSRSPSPVDLFLFVIGCRHHALGYRLSFPDAPLISERGEELDTHIRAYIETCDCQLPLRRIITVLGIGRKLLAIETNLECPGISLAMFLTIRTLGQMQVRDIFQLIQLIGTFGQFPSILKAGHTLDSQLEIYQERYARSIQKYT